MQDFFKKLEKYIPYILAAATAYWAVVALIGDLLYMIFPTALYFIVRLFYLVVGLVGVLELIKMFNPALYKKITEAGSKTPKEKK